jgi:cellulose synthase operon protein C
MDRGQYDAAIGNLREALNDQPRDADLLVLLAAAFERSGSMELADERLAYATRVSNFDPKVGLQYVAFLRRRGNVARSEDVLQQLAGRAPGNQDVLMGLAQTKLARRDWAGAQEVADNILRIGTNPGLANQIMSETLAGQSKLNESIAVLEAAYEARPEATQPIFALVRAYMRAQKLNEAEAFLNRVAADTPSNVEAKVLLGSVKLARNQPAEAEKIFLAVVKDQPKNPAGYRALAALYMRQNKNNDALKAIRGGLAVQPEEPALRLSLAQVHELNGDYETAIKEYEALVAAEPGSVVFANNLASLLLDHRTDAASLEKAGVLAARLRKSPVAHFKDTVGWLHYRRGEYKAAIALLEEAAKELPNLPVVHYHLGVSYIANNQPDKGAERLRKALELLPNGGVSEKAVRTAMEKAGAM